MRLGILGGTFDPLHVGHLIAASDAYEALTLDHLIFVPAATQPLKARSPAAKPEHRLAMLRIAIAGDDRFAADPIEIDRKGLSYTVDTLEALAGRYPDAERYLLVGADVLDSFPKWREPERVLRLARLAVMERGEVKETVAEPAHMIGSATSRLADGPLPLRAAVAADPPVMFSTRRVDVSSTEVRERVRAGRSLTGFVPTPVADYIRSHGLYR